MQRYIKPQILFALLACLLTFYSPDSIAANNPERAVDPRGPAKKTTNFPGDREFNQALSHIQTVDFKSQNYKKALEFFHMAADLGHADSMYQLHLIYRNNVNINARPFFDLAKAKIWLIKAAKEGNHEAQYTLGRMYEKGTEGLVDKEKAAHFYRQAAKNGSWQAEKALKRIEYFKEYEEFKTSGSKTQKRRFDAMADLFCSVARVPTNHPAYEECRLYSYKCLKSNGKENHFNEAYLCISKPLREIIYHQRKSPKPPSKAILNREYLALKEFLSSYEANIKAEEIFRRYKLKN